MKLTKAGISATLLARVSILPTQTESFHRDAGGTMLFAR
jgi:hypothetical protein